MTVLLAGVMITQVLAFLANPITVLPIAWTGGRLAESTEPFGGVTNTIGAIGIPSLSNTRLSRRNPANDKDGELPPSGSENPPKRPALRLVLPLAAKSLANGGEKGANSSPEPKIPENLLASDNTPLTEVEWNAATEHLLATHRAVHESVAPRMGQLWTTFSGQTRRIRTTTKQLGPYHGKVQSVRALRKDTIAKMRKKTQSFAKLEDWAGKLNARKPEGVEPFQFPTLAPQPLKQGGIRFPGFE